MAVQGASARGSSSSRLFSEYRHGSDRQARDELIERYLPLARRLAWRYAASSEPYEDLAQVASVGLIKAVERFDPDHGCAFTSFAVPTIVGEIKRYFRDSGWAVHVERGAQERARRIAQAQRQLAAGGRRAPDVDQLAEFLECSHEEVLDGLQVLEAYDAVSLDVPVGPDDDEGAARVETLGRQDDELERVDAQVTLFAAARHLPQREREILYLRFEEDLTQSQIAARTGISQMQVSRLLRRSLQRLRELTEGASG